MPTRHRVAHSAQILGQTRFHLNGDVVRHRIQVLEQLGQKANPVAFDNRGCFDACFVVGEPLFGSEAGHSNINALFFWISLGVFRPDLSQLADGWVQKDDIDIVMKPGLAARTMSLEGSALHY